MYAFQEIVPILQRAVFGINLAIIRSLVSIVIEERI